MAPLDNVPHEGTPASIDLEQGREKIAGLVDTTKNLLLDLLRIQKHIQQYGSDDRFQNNTDLQNLIGQLTTFQDSVTKEQSTVKNYIEKKKEKNKKKKESIKRKKLLSPQPITKINESNEMDFGELISKNLTLTKNQLQVIDECMIILASNKHGEDVDTSTIAQSVNDFNRNLNRIYELGVNLMSNVKIDTFYKNRKLTGFQESTGEEWTLHDLTEILKYTQSCLTRLSFMIHEISQPSEKTKIKQENLLQVFDFCVQMYDFFILHQEFNPTLRQFFQSNHLTTNALILKKMTEEKHHKRMHNYYMFDQL